MQNNVYIICLLMWRVTSILFLEGVYRDYYLFTNEKISHDVSVVLKDMSGELHDI
jgi:hypothetical protein